MSPRRAKKPATRAKKTERIVRITALSVAVAVGLWFSFCCIRKTVRPFSLYRTEAMENARIEKQINELKQENAQLRNKARYLKTPEGAQAEARTLGWVRKGEISIVVKPEAENSEQTN